MKKNTPLWILIGLLVLVIILVAPRGLTSNYPASMHSDYGMMGSGMMGYGMIGFWWIIPVLLFVLVIAAGVWLGNFLTFRKHLHPSKEPHVCPKCSKPTEADWITCPYCSEPLEK